LTKELLQRRVATRGDADLLALAATLWDRWRRCMDHVIAEGEVIKVQRFSKKGTPYTCDEKNPHLEIAQATEKQFLSVLQQLGLTVATRDKPKVTKGNSVEEPDEESNDAFLNRYLHALDGPRVVPMRPAPTEMVAEDEEEEQANADGNVTTEL
jgi:P27 family predicted phage terminase small subunit